MFALTHQFLQQLIEGDELYTRVKKNVAPDESQGWTIVLMDRATRFLWDMHCGRKDRKMFKKAMSLLCQVIEQTGDLTLLTDLLEISRYDAGSVQLEYEPTSLAHLAEDVIASMQQLAEQHPSERGS